MITGYGITKEMVFAHAEKHDEYFMGEIIVKALGINGTCTGFCRVKKRGSDEYRDDIIRLFWMLYNGKDVVEDIPIKDVMKRLETIKISVER